MRQLIAVLAVVLGVSNAFAAESISQVLPCGKVGVAGGLGAGTDLQRQIIDTRRFPEAICNDGTPGIFYFARYSKDEDRDKWIIFLQGGGGCASAQACANRWCSIDTNYGMDKMSTSLSKPSIRGNGFLDPRSSNRFSTWNRVLIYYCSSDTWSGTSTKTVQAAGGGQTAEFNINFKGSRIIDAVLDTLRYTNLGRNRAIRIGPQPQNSLPDLDNATHVLFAGSSGGGRGAIDNADRVGAKLRQTNPDVVFRVVIDAIFDVDKQNLDWTKTTYCASSPTGCSYDLAMQQSHQADIDFFEAVTDESCLTWHASHAPGTEWRCADGYHEVTNHVTTPMFVHMDEQDSTIGGEFVEAGFGTPSDFGAGVEHQLRALATLNSTAEEKGALATPGAFGPQCTDHESFTNDAATYDVHLTGLSYHDVVWNWWSGAQPQSVIRAFSGPGAAADCPK